MSGGQAQQLAHRLVSEETAPLEKSGKRRGPQPKVDKGYKGSGVPWEAYKEASKKFSQAIADKELTVRKAAEGALASGVKISKSTIAQHAKDHPGQTPEHKGSATLIPKEILAHEAACNHRGAPKAEVASVQGCCHWEIASVRE